MRRTDKKWNHNMKAELTAAFQAPPPLRRETFLEELRLMHGTAPMAFPEERPSLGRFLLTQAGYIRKRIWVLDLLALLLAGMGALFCSGKLLWLLSALMPLLALTALTESGRSQRCGMSELELSTRFPLKSVTLARLGLLGIVNFLLLGILIPLGSSLGAFSLIRTGIYLTCPYLITTLLGLWLLRRIRGQEAVLLCTGGAALVSCAAVLLPHTFAFLYETDHFIWWQLAFLLLLFGVLRECRRTVKQTEELVWNC